MKIIIIGLGNYGGELAKELTSLGHEVIGVDRNETKVESHKSKVTICIAMDATDENSLASLPIKESDMVIVAIGEDHEASILVTALMKQQGVAHLISRAFNPIQRAILEAIGVEHIIMPETESALRYAKQITYKGVQSAYSLSDNYGIIEVKTPEQLVGKTIDSLQLSEEYRLKLIALKRTKSTLSLLKNKTEVHEVEPNFNGQTTLQHKDELVLFGANDDLKALLKKWS